MPVSPTIRPAQVVVVERLDVFVEERHAVALGRGLAARSGKHAGGTAALFPSNGTPRSKPQYETSNRGLMSTMSAKVACFEEW